MKKIPYFTIEGTPGGNQEWCTDFWMYLGGCAALAACDMSICLARNYGFAGCLPFDPGELNRENYVMFSSKMKPYIHPRMHGVTKLSIFTEGFGQYLRDRGYGSEFITCRGQEDADKAYRMIEETIDRGLPAAYLMLRHHNRKYSDLNWHWFSITGCGEKNGKRMLCYHTYGEELEVDFDDLWDTGMFYRGGIVAIKKVWKI